MTRDPRTDPRPGDKLHHPKFARGAECWVINRGEPNPKSLATRTRDGYVAVRWFADDGHPIDARGRCYGLAYWPTFMADATIVHVEPTTTEETRCDSSCSA
jgi:hypothetical protein